MNIEFQDTETRLATATIIALHLIEDMIIQQDEPTRPQIIQDFTDHYLSIPDHQLLGEDYGFDPNDFDQEDIYERYIHNLPITNRETEFMNSPGHYEQDIETYEHDLDTLFDN